MYVCVCAGKQLHHKPRCDDWADAKLHESALIRSENDTHPIQRVRGFGVRDAIERDLAAHQVDEEGDRCPENLLLDRDLS